MPADVLAGALAGPRGSLHDPRRDGGGDPRSARRREPDRAADHHDHAIPVDKIGEVIGPRGERINEIIAQTGADIDIRDDGTVFIGSHEGEGADEAAG